MREPSQHQPSLLIGTGPLAWTFPAGLLLVATSAISIAVLLLLYPSLTTPPCEMELRIQLTFALPAGIGAFLLAPAVEIGSPALRWLAGLFLGAIVGAAAWLAIAAMFPRFC
jgi:hypothetical protein